MAIKTYSIPEKDPDDIKIDDAVRAYCKKHHINMSALIVSLIKVYAKDKQI